MKEGEVEGKRMEKEEDGMAVCSKQRTVTRARGVRDVEYVWRMWRSLYTPPGSLWGHSGFWYVISEIPVYLCVACCPCAMFQLERVKRALVRCESGITCAGGRAGHRGLDHRAQEDKIIPRVGNQLRERARQKLPLSAYLVPEMNTYR